MTTPSPQASPQASPALPARQARSEGDLLRTAFRRRAEHAVELITASASPEALALALQAPTDFGALASALGSTVMPGPALDLDPFADALARGTAERERLAVRAGGLLSAEQAGQALGGISRQAVDKRRRANALLAVRVVGDWRYPAVQIDADGQVPDALPAVLKLAAGIGMSGWATLDFLLAPDDALGGIAPFEALRRDGADGVRRLLEAAGSDSFG